MRANLVPKLVGRIKLLGGGNWERKHSNLLENCRGGGSIGKDRVEKASTDGREKPARLPHKLGFQEACLARLRAAPETAAAATIIDEEGGKERRMMTDS